MVTHDGIASDLIAIINQCIALRLGEQPRAYAAYIVPGSWNAKSGTVRVQRSHLLAVSDADGDAALYDVDLPLLTTAFGHQYGPRGYEPCSIIPRAHGYAVVLEHDDATSPNAVSGEHHFAHYSKTGVIDARLKFTNDGPTANDEKAGLVGLLGALILLATTAGISLRMDDTASKTTLVSPITQIGADSLDATLDAIVTVRQMRAYVDAIYNAHVHPGVSTGGASTAPPSTTMTSQGSTTVRAKP